MWNKRFKVLTMAIILLFLYSCMRTTTYIAPVESQKISSAKEIIVLLNDGTELKLKHTSIKEEKLTGYTKNKAKKEIDLSSIHAVKIEKSNAYFVVLYGGVAVVAALLTIGVATAPEPPPTKSCPFIYSFDGKNYVFDAEPYGGAICQSLKRAEWCGLEHIKEINGQYRVLVANELDETQYTDELKVVIVDHPKGTKVAPDISGKIHSILHPLIPVRAVDGKGNDILAVVSKKDEKFWQTRVTEKNPDKKEDLKDELIFEFPKPADAKKVKLLVNACTSLWGSQVAKKFLELYGNNLDQWYKEVNNFGPAYQRIMKWYFNEELYLLQIRVETKSGWKSKGTIFGGGPFISEDKVYAIDISDVPGDTLRIKITPPATFWMIDYLSVDYTEDSDLQIREIGPNQAFYNQDQDVCVKLASNDNNYLIMPNKGDKAGLVFPSPPKIEGMDRSVILKAIGYYDIHLKAEGEPQQEILEKIHSEPGFTIQYALKEYIKSKGCNRDED
jgi:hypothetical protein